MSSVPAVLLLITGGAPLLSIVLVIAATWLNRRALALIATGIGIVSMTLAAAGVTVALASVDDPAGSVLEIPVWTWFSLTAQPASAVAFGLEATSLKGGLVSTTGVVMLLVLAAGTRRWNTGLSFDAIMAANGICVGAIGFLLAPNLAQALLGWALGSVSAAILIRLSDESGVSAGGSVARPGSEFVFPILYRSQTDALNRHSRWQRVSSGISACEQVLWERMWRPLTDHFPNWIGEQVEFLGSRSRSVQLLAGALGTFAMLLTWLIGG